MSKAGDKQVDELADCVIPFPQSRTKPKVSQQALRNLGLSELAKQLSCVEASLKGHWCSQCTGIWYGCGGECECPVCGNRNG